MSQHEVNAKGLLCPLPVIRLQSKINQCQPGDIVIITCTDPGALHDVPAWCRIHGHQLLEQTEDNNEFQLTVEVQSS